MDRLYTIEIYNSSGERLADISELCLTRTYQLRRNRSEDIRLTLNLEKAQQLAQDLGLGFYDLYAAGINEIRITRGNRVMVGGQIAYAHPRLNRASDPTLEIRAWGFLELLSFRYLDDLDQTVSFTNQDMGQIAWQMIDQSQKLYGEPSADFGITQGTIQTSRTITQTWAPWTQTLKEILIGLTEREDSVDFEFTPDKKFNVYYPGMGTTKTDVVLAYPGNITNLGAPQDATQLVNLSYNRGEGNGDSQFTANTLNEASWSIFKIRHRVDDYPSVKDTATLAQKGSETLRLYDAPVVIPELVMDGSQEPFIGAYWIGDWVKVSIDPLRYPAFASLDDEYWRINEITCVVNENDHEEVTVKVGRG